MKRKRKEVLKIKQSRTVGYNVKAFSWQVAVCIAAGEGVICITADEGSISIALDLKAMLSCLENMG